MKRLSRRFAVTAKHDHGDQDIVLMLYDREKGVASNVHEFLRLSDGKRQLGSLNLRRHDLSNVLGNEAFNASSIKLLVRDEKKVEALLTMWGKGWAKLEVLVARLCPGYIEPIWSASDLSLMELKKQPARYRAWTTCPLLEGVARCVAWPLRVSLPRQKLRRSQSNPQTSWMV